MSNINNINIEAIARSSKIIINPSEHEAFAKKLANVINWIDEIKNINTNGIEPLVNIISDLEECNYRNDNVQKTPASEVIPEKSHIHEEYFAVPKVVE